MLCYVKSSHCRYFKNCIRRKCESSSIPISAKLRWGVETRPPGVEFLPEVGGRQDEVGGSTPNSPGNSNTELSCPTRLTEVATLPILGTRGRSDPCPLQP